MEDPSYKNTIGPQSGELSMNVSSSFPVCSMHIFLGEKVDQLVLFHPNACGYSSIKNSVVIIERFICKDVYSV